MALAWTLPNSLPPSLRMANSWPDADKRAFIERYGGNEDTSLLAMLDRQEPLGWQNEVVSTSSRFNVIDVGRRAGKTHLGLDLCAGAVTGGRPIGWFSPTYKMLGEVWRSAVNLFAPITVRKNATDRRIEFTGGGLLEFWSLENPDSARGRRYQRIIVDEAAMVPALMDAWNFVLRPTLADWLGDAWFLSTPKGRNGFWQMWQYGQDPGNADWMSWQMPSTVNPKVPAEEFEAMRLSMPERIYAQEILAQFLEDAGGIFRNVVARSTAVQAEQPHAMAGYIMGVDWGKMEDFTVLSIIDARTGTQVYMDRFNQIDYAVQTGRLRSLAQRFGVQVIVAERNSIGEPLIESLQREGLPVQPFMMTNATKARIIDALALAFETGSITTLNDPIQIAELQAYEMERLPSGMMRYSAPDGMHDDTVIALALAWYGASRQSDPGQLAALFGWN